MANAANKSIRLFIVAGGSYLQREQQIATAIQMQPEQLIAVILEGLPNGSPLLQSESQSGSKILIERIAPGCFCCIGQLVLQVTLNRLIRQRPHTLYIGMNDPAHSALLQERLCQPPYQTLLTLENLLQLS